MPLLPSEKVFHVFELCAAHQSFTKAADILGTTPSAVSQQIKLLEHLVKLKLFHRQGRRVILSPEGRSILAAQAKGFDTIRQAVQSAQSQKQGLKASVQVLPGFCVRWLLPRLADFEKCHPEVEITLLGNDGVGMSQEADLAIEYVPFEKERWLAEEQMFPVVSPDFFDKNKLSGLAREDVLKKLWELPLLADNSVVGGDTWREWAGFQNVFIPMENVKRFPQSNMSLTLAEYGRGVAMGRTSLVQDSLASGALLEIRGFRSPASAGYTLRYNPNRSQNNGSDRFAKWITNAIRLERFNKS